MKKLLASSALTLALAGGSALGLASAAGASTTAGTPVASAPSGRHGAAATWLRAHRRAVRQFVVSVSAATIGVTGQQLVAELKTGKSIADVAAEHSVSSQTVVDALVKGGDAKIQSAVNDGKITSARAQAMEGRLPTLAGKLVAHVFGQHTGTTPAPAAS